MKAFRLIILGFLMFHNTYAQNKNIIGKYRSPLDIPLYLSGNFGEIRSDHFHSGLDFKTQGVTGQKVYAVDDGYVSRIKIQTLGYGNSIYISHPGGITSVYGHLEKFSDSIAQYVRNYQYQKNSQTLDIYPDKDLFRVKKGDIIALSGNTGSSGGPHLHFELRGTSSQHTLNALRYGFDVKDTQSPRISGLYVYPVGETEKGKYPDPKIYITKKELGHYSISSDTLTLKGKIGFGLDANDSMDGSESQVGVFSIELLVNEVPIYVFKIDEFSFGESPYLNAHIDYFAKTEKNKKIHLLYHKPNNQLSLYPVLINNGLYEFPVSEVSKVEIRVNDAYDNTSSLVFFVKGSASESLSLANDSVSGQYFKWDNPNYYSNNQINFSLPSESLFEDYIFNYSRSESGFQKIYPFTHYIGNSATPIIKPADLSINAEMIPQRLRNKTLIAYFPSEKNISCFTSTWYGDKISAKVNKLGKYTIVTDTIPPAIQSLNFKAGANMSQEKSMKFKITDDLSGINEYSGTIDGAWVLFEYDPKNDLISYSFDKTRLIAGQEHELKLNIRDLAGNQKIYTGKFIW